MIDAIGATPIGGLGSAATPLAGRTVTWTSSVPGVCAAPANGTTDANGTVSPVLTILAAGTTNLQATCGGVVSNIVVVTGVAPAAVSTVTVSPASLSGLVGASGVLSAVVKDGANNVLTGRVVTWATSNAAVAGWTGGTGSTLTVNYLSAGTANVQAWCEGVGSAVVTVTVTAPAAPVATVTISPTALSGTVGGSGTLSATVKDASGNVLAGRTITWASSAPSIASVTSSGQSATVSYLTNGAASITAQSEGINSSAVAVSVTGGSGGGVTPFFVEDWSTYAGTADWKGAAGAARGWGGYTAGTDSNNLVLDATTPYPGLSKSLKYTFPATGTCGQPACGRQWVPAAGITEAWIEFAVQWQSIWNTTPNGAWGCTFAPDHKFLRIHLSDGNTGCGYFGFKDGHFGNQFVNSYPCGGTGRWDIGVATSTPYYDGQWHVVRLHLKLSNTNAGIYYFAIDGVVKNDWTTGCNYAVSPLPTMSSWDWGDNMNNFPQQTQSYWIGYFKVWTSSPGWG